MPVAAILCKHDSRQRKVKQVKCRRVLHISFFFRSWCKMKWKFVYVILQLHQIQWFSILVWMLHVMEPDSDCDEGRNFKTYGFSSYFFCLVAKYCLVTVFPNSKKEFCNTATPSELYFSCNWSCRVILAFFKNVNQIPFKIQQTLLDLDQNCHLLFFNITCERCW